MGNNTRRDKTATRRARATAVLEAHVQLVALLAALLTVAAAVLSVVTASLGRANDDLGQDITEANAEIIELREAAQVDAATIEAQKGMLKDKDAEIRDLRTLVPPTIDESEVPQIRSAGRVTLAQDGDTIDLNSTFDNWAVDDYVYYDTLRYNGKDLRANQISSVTLREGNASYETCALASGYAKANSLDPVDLEKANVCLRLDSGRFASVIVERFDVDSVDLAITVWQNG